MKNDKLVEAKALYQKGVVLELTEALEDPYSPKPVGARFVVDYVDDAMNIHGSWVNPESGCLSLIVGVDKFRIVEEQSQ